MSLNHARHNKEACDFLRESKKFNDWVVTTAYYSALHYAHCELFPLQCESPSSGRVKTYNSFDEIYHERSNKGTSKHGFLLELTEEHIPEISDEFRTLKELCWTARYSNYNVSEQISDACFESLEVISEYCEPVSI